MLGREEVLAEPAPRRGEPDLSFRAVAFADIAGSTALAEAHELEAFRYVRRVLGMLRRRARACGGRVVDEAGDGSFAAFPSADQAVAWAVGSHQALPRVRPGPAIAGERRLRIGVHAGPVLVHGARLFGRTVAIACRLQQAAAPGATLVSAAVADALAPSGRLRLAPAGDVPLKGTAVRVRAVRVEGLATGVAAGACGRGRAVTVFAMAAQGFRPAEAHP